MKTSRLNDEAEKAATALNVPAPAVALHQIEATSGVYSLTARSPEALQDLGLRDRADETPLIERVLYVGKAEASLLGRLEATHFASARTGWSTVRRTFAALLGLSPASRPTRIVNPTHGQLMTMSANYALQNQDEVQLTEWMLEHLEIRFFASEWTPLKQLERAVGVRLKPPLDQERPPMWQPNPWYDEVAAARGRLRLQVRHQLGLSR